ncbi:MAG: hypothetical protein AAF399_13995 [Bacteroidota bacterium]
MRHLLAFLLAVLAVPPLHAQEFFFPKENYTDRTTLATALPELARSIQAISDGQLTPSNHMHLALIAGEYEAAIVYLDSMRLPFDDDYKNGVFVPFETFARTKSQQQSSAFPAFSPLFEDQFLET